MGGGGCKESERKRVRVEVIDLEFEGGSINFCVHRHVCEVGERERERERERNRESIRVCEMEDEVVFV